jgi:hypothetical protein
VSAEAKRCKDFEVCGKMADPRYTMDFTDVEPGAFIHWCETCGPFWTEIGEALTEKLREEPAFAGQLEASMDKHNQ